MEFEGGVLCAGGFFGNVGGDADANDIAKYTTVEGWSAVRGPVPA